MLTICGADVPNTLPSTFVGWAFVWATLMARIMYPRVCTMLSGKDERHTRRRKGRAPRGKPIIRQLDYNLRARHRGLSAFGVFTRREGMLDVGVCEHSVGGNDVIRMVAEHVVSRILTRQEEDRIG